MDPKIAALLGFARKANKLVSGESAAVAILKKGQAGLVILAEDISPNLHKKYALWCADEGIPLISTGTKHDLGMNIGLSPRSVIVVTDDKFAQSILQTGGFDQRK